MGQQRENRRNHTIKRKKIKSLGLLLLTTFLLFFLISSFNYPPLKREIEKDVKNFNRKTGTLKTSSTNSKKANGKVIYLTFDDGPSSATDDILKTLQEHQAKATFFMLSPHMQERPDVVKRIVEEGHSVGLHGVTHDVNQFYHSKQTVLGEMNEAQKVLESITGIHSVLIRSPYGSVPYLVKPFRKALNAQGYQIWDWNMDSRDWDLKNGKYVETVIEQIQQFEGNDATQPVVLLHDKSNTAKYLPKLLGYLTKQGFQMKKLDDSIEPVQFKCYDRCHRLDEQ